MTHSQHTAHSTEHTAQSSRPFRDFFFPSRKLRLNIRKSRGFYILHCWGPTEAPESRFLCSKQALRTTEISLLPSKIFQENEKPAWRLVMNGTIIFDLISFLLTLPFLTQCLTHHPLQLSKVPTVLIAWERFQSYFKEQKIDCPAVERWWWHRLEHSVCLESHYRLTTGLVDHWAAIVAKIVPGSKKILHLRY